MWRTPLKNGKPILYPSSSKVLPLEREQLKFSNGWCETAKFWVDDKGMESIAFKKPANLVQIDRLLP